MCVWGFLGGVKFLEPNKQALLGGLHLVWEDGRGLVDGGGVLLTGDVAGGPDLLGVVHAHSRGLGEDDSGEGHGGGVLLTCKDVAWAPCLLDC